MIYLPFIFILVSTLEFIFMLRFFIFIIGLVLITSQCMILVHLVCFRILLSFLISFIRNLLLILVFIFCSVNAVILSIVGGVCGVIGAWLLRFFITRSLI